ncbi:hypothetical protein GCM10008922_02390 [Faecalicatena contorta]
MGDACKERDFSRGPGNFPVPFRRLSVCQVSLEKNHIGLEGTTGIHRAILMNCAAQAGLNSASEAEFSLPVRCGFSQVKLRRSLCPRKGTGKFPGPRLKSRSSQAGRTRAERMARERAWTGEMG